MTYRGSTGPKRGPGRPRVEAPGTAKLSETRRGQIRRAQKHYRLKKEAALQSSATRAADLELRLQKISNAVFDLQRSARTSGLDTTHPQLYDRLNDVLDLLPFAGELSHQQTSTHHVEASPLEELRRITMSSTINHEILDHSKRSGAFQHQTEKGFELAPTGDNNHVVTQVQMGTDSVGEMPFPGRQCHIDRPIGNGPHTYSFQETNFSRRLHRRVLEHAFRIFIDDRSDPSTVYRTFRLVPCIRNKVAMHLGFERLLSRGIGERLELPGLPFYSIGGAGKHYPKMDKHGAPIYPSNARLPRRILGLIPATNPHDMARAEVDRQRALKLFCLDGEWFDCNDVEGYLESKGAIINTDSGCIERVTSTGEPGGMEDASSSIGKHNSAGSVESRGILDIDLFLNYLLTNFVILGRAPGFPKSHVDYAYRKSLRNYEPIELET